MRSGGALWVVLALAGCPAAAQVPGDVVLGTYSFSVTPFQDGCAFERDAGEAVLAPDPFVATLSYDTKEHTAYLVSGPTQLKGTLEGNQFVVQNPIPARRDLPKRAAPDGGSATCGCPGSISERLEATLYAATDLVGGCATERLVDAGVPFSLRDGGPELGLVCGFLTDELAPLDNASCACDPCLLVYAIAGTRQ